jgi:hypothetical protein
MPPIQHEKNKQDSKDDAIVIVDDEEENNKSKEETRVVQDIKQGDEDIEEEDNLE